MPTGQPFNLKNLENSQANLKLHQPLIVNITNTVTIETIANILLAIGASPIMTQSIEELPELLCIDDALVLNMGTIDQHWITLAHAAMTEAQKNKRTIVFDPVGAGATTFRTQQALSIIEKGVDLIKGNASEIIALAQHTQNTKGVDSSVDSSIAIEAACNLANQYQCITVITGKTDYVCTKNHYYHLTAGSNMLTKVTGMGCALTAVIAAFLVTENDSIQAAQAALAYYNFSAEKAAKKATGPGSFKQLLIDALIEAHYVAA